MTDRKLLEDVRDALKPFAKAGELFVNRDPRLSMQAIYTPAAGDEYNIVSGDLEFAERNQSCASGPNRDVAQAPDYKRTARRQRCVRSPQPAQALGKS